MLAVGDFSVTKEKWRNKEVSFYVEKKFAKESPHIFKNTTGMLDFFSQKLGVDFPWEKYAQVVVRDYPGGSMENTSATLHGEFMLTTERERLDDAKEEYISHELMHQWFGDLVTCESWSNLPLNESFATYGEYLWLEHKEGKEAADVHLQADLNNYFTEAKSKQANLIRFDYDDRDEMFDRHSYEKGCRIIHMLHNYLGDDAFFEALKTYLNEHRFSAVEVHDLRLAFEKVSGKDLNWFFNQWFLASGFPFLNISTEYQPDNKTIHVQIEQTQGGQNTPIYRLPIAIDVYSFGKKERHLVQIENKKQEFVFSASAKPNLVNVDADKVLLCKKRENKSIEEWVFQYKNAPLYLDRFEAIDAMGQFSQSKSKETIRLALQDKNWSIRKLALMKIEKWHKPDSEIKAELMDLVLKDKKPDVRSKSLDLLVKFYNGDEVLEILKTATEDNSYAVVSSALKLLFEKDPEAGFEESKRFEEDSSLSIGNTLLTIFATAGSDAEAPFFLRQDKFMGDYARYGYLQLFGKYLVGRSDSVINISLPVFENAATNSKVWWVRLAALQAIKDLKDMYQERENELMLKKKTGGVASKKSNYTVSNTLENAQKQKEKLDKLFNTLKEKESSADVLRNF
jgi:aminopeptidase N